MTALIITVILLALAVIYLWIELYSVKKRQNGAIYIRRKGDLVFLEDGDGNLISEKIIINPIK